MFRQLTNRRPWQLLSVSLTFSVLSVQVSLVRAGAKSEAYVGTPFGVGKVTIDVLRGEPVLPLSDERFTAVEASGRVLYPVLQQEPVSKFIRGLLDLEAPRKVTIYYLFKGQDPFDLSAFTPYEQGVRVKPIRDPSRHRKLLQDWWEQYTKYFQNLLKNRDYPPVAENFLIASLSRRLDLEVPNPRTLASPGWLEDYALSYLLVDEAHRLRTDRALLREDNEQQRTLVDLPEANAWPKLAINGNARDEVAVEPIAKYVPAECFYVRFGNFPNYLWFRDLSKKWQGDLGNMLLRRGIKRNSSQRIQQQLSLRESALAKILGPQVIADVAIIGLDHYVEQGAAIGILFQAKNDILLAADLIKQRREALTKFDDATEQTLDIGGKQVSLISTPGGEVRSYYVQQDGYHLVATSKTLMERFLQAGKGVNTLASLPSFRHIRQSFPFESNHTAFIFVSDAYWQNLCKPQHFVENLRRMRSSRESVVLGLAKLAAQAEGAAAVSKEELIEAKYLPRHFGFHSDDSRLKFENETIIDSARGARGYFLPIADMTVEKVSHKEAATYRRFIDKLTGSLGQLPPIVAALTRDTADDGKHELLTLDVRTVGSLRSSLGNLGFWLGQPSNERVGPIEGNLIAAEVALDFPMPGEDNSHQLFGALRDSTISLNLDQGVIAPNAPIDKMLHGYAGAWPKPGFLTLFNSRDLPKDEQPEQINDDRWQAKKDDFLLISFKPEIVREVLPQLELQPAEREAQVWLRIGDLTDTKIAELATAFGYSRTRDTSAAGSRMMNSLANQLHVPRHECRELAERLVDGGFHCPLGGEYQLYAPDRGLEVWASSALPEQNRFLLTDIPEDFQLPLLGWFRGLNGDLRLDERALSIHVEIEMTSKALP